MTNYHTHTTWCDGRDTPEAMVRAALEKEFADSYYGEHNHYGIYWLKWAEVRKRPI